MTFVWITLVIYVLLALFAFAVYADKRVNTPEKLERDLREVRQEIAQTYRDNEVSEPIRATEPEFVRRHIMQGQIAKLRGLKEEERRLLLKLGRPY